MLTPVKAIRSRCVDCAEDRKTIRDCPQETCALRPFRMGRRPARVEGTKVPGPLKSIRKYCKWCMCEQVREIDACPSEGRCPLWVYRYGRRPTTRPRKVRKPDYIEGLPEDPPANVENHMGEKGK